MSNLFGDDEPEAPAIEEKIAEIEAAEAEEISPRNNPDLVGHGAAEAALLADFNAGRMPHAIILAGPEGVGKATLAYRLARFLLSQEEQGAGLFGEPEKPSSLRIEPNHPVFRRVASGGHADLLTVEREWDEKKERMKNDISVESVRRIAPFLRKTAAEGGWRAVIVDGAECLNASSQNALLKILEEPPAKAVLILTTTQPGGLLPTIRSRCRMVRLEALPDRDLSALLAKHVPSEDERAVLAELAGGSIGRALRLQKEGGVALHRDLMKALAMLPETDGVLVHDLAEKIGRYGAEQMFETARGILTGWCARQARAAARAGGPRHYFHAWEKLETLFRQTEQYNLDRRLAVISAFLALQKPEYQGLNI